MLHEIARMVGIGGDDSALSRPSVGEDTSPGTPSIGLALGGGAARGWAHIGVLRALLEAGYKPQIISGTSIGAVVGGCYAAGKLDELEEWALGLTKRRVFSFLDFSLNGGGLISGARLRGLLEQQLGDLGIEELPIRFSAVATEIRTGHEIWLTKGRLVPAMRASYALPGIFESVRVGGRWLIDGAMVNPVPISTARALGARLVIGVNLQANVYGRGAVVPMHGTDDSDAAAVSPASEELVRSRFTVFPRQALRERVDGAPGIPTVMMEAFNIIQDRISRARLAGDPPDVMVGPKLAHIGLFEFHRAKEAIQLGREATERALEGIAESVEALA